MTEIDATPESPDVLPTALTSEDKAGPDNLENDDDVEEGDDTPLDGDTLAPGYHLIELATAVPCRQDVLLAGLSRIGFQGIRTDRSRPIPSFAVREHRFIGDLKQAVMLHQKDAMQWTFARPLSVDVGRSIRTFRLRLEAFELEPGTLYEALFLTRERSQPTRAIVEQHLSEMGFIPIKLVSLQDDIRLDTRPDTSVAIWFGLLEWDAPASVLTEEDPFYFEDLVAVGTAVTDEDP